MVVDTGEVTKDGPEYRGQRCDVMIQAALEEEIAPVIRAMRNPTTTGVGPWTFWLGSIQTRQVVLCRTDEGPLNASAACALGIHVFRPQLILNHGLAGAHNPELRKGDIVVGKFAVDYSAFESLPADAGEGIQCGRWNPKAHKIRTAPDCVTRFFNFPADPRLVELAARVPYEAGKVVIGTVGSALQYNCEVDRIQWLRETYGTDCEDQESAYAAGVAVAMAVPFLSIRVISDSMFGDPVLTKSLGRLSAEFVLSLIELISTA